MTLGLLPTLGRGGAVVVGTLILMPMVIRVLRGRILDEPNERSSHAVVTPRGGGIGPAVVSTAVLCAWWTGPRGRMFAGLITACVAMGLLGFIDDVRPLPAPVRLLGQAVIAATAAVLFTSGMHESAIHAAEFVLAAGWLVAFVNAFNFMDGINGISAVTAFATGVTWLTLGVWKHAGGLAIVGAVAAGAGLGFLPFNFPRARIFLGDVGSYFFGTLLGCGAVIGLLAGLHPEAVLAPLLLYVLDTGSTLIRRGSRGANVLEAHRDHTYQRICGRGWSHTVTTGLVAAVLAAVGGLGLVAQGGGRLRVVADIGVVALSAGYLLLPRLLDRQSRVVEAN
jgi:UDP-GlcNAc:undecaprenyl-phosphate/decaprenyl-phosphate GlcNAc-1-phosphate transferase